MRSMFYDPMKDRMVHFDVGTPALFQVHFRRADRAFHRFFDSSFRDVTPVGVTRWGRFKGEGLFLVAVQNRISTYPPLDDVPA